MLKNPRRIVLGTGKLAIANSDGETKAGFTIPTAFGIWKNNDRWAHLIGVRISGKRVRLIAEILEGEK